MKTKKTLIVGLCSVAFFITGCLYNMKAEGVKPAIDFLEWQDCYEDIESTGNPDDEVIKCGFLNLCKFKCGRPINNTQKGRCLEI